MSQTAHSQDPAVGWQVFEKCGKSVSLKIKNFYSCKLDDVRVGDVYRFVGYAQNIRHPMAKNEDWADEKVPRFQWITLEKYNFFPEFLRFPDVISWEWKGLRKNRLLRSNDTYVGNERSRDFKKLVNYDAQRFFD
ncbi:hypothetical protein AB6A40_011534, partial [Gnathostoma spinigerum]